MRHLFILLTALAGFASAPLGQADTRPNIKLVKVILYQLFLKSILQLKDNIQL